MAATTCAYGYEYDSRSCRLLMPAARSSQIMEPFDNDSTVMPPPPAPPPLPPPPPPLLLGARGNPSNSKATPRLFGLCTEGLGSESSESSGDLNLSNVADDDNENDADVDVGQALPCKRQLRDSEEKEKAAPARTRCGRAFPPPISVIGAAGKPWQYLRAHRGDGRLVLQEVRIPSRELLQACREDGRLKLHFAHPEEQQLVDDQCHGRKSRTSRCDGAKQ